MRDCKHDNEQAAWRKAHYDAADINDKLIINLRDMSHTMRSMYEGRGSQKRILIILREMGGCVTQRELTERLGIQSGSASEVIAKLEGAGYIRREPNGADRRTVDVSLTENGRIMAEEAKRQRLCRHEKMFACLSEGEKLELLSLFEKINADWETRDHGMGERHKAERPHHHRSAETDGRRKP